jgi:hypothetical protein
LRRRARTTVAIFSVLTLALGGCVAGATGPSPTEPLGITTTTTLPTTTTTLSRDEGLEAYEACLSEQGVTIGEIRLDARGRPRMAEALSDVDLGDRAVLDALEACGGVLASGPLDLEADPELAELVRARLREFAECVRRVGVVDYPDPVSGFEGVGSPFPPNRIPWSHPELAEAVNLCSAGLGS